VYSSYAKVGHPQAPILKTLDISRGFFIARYQQQPKTTCDKQQSMATRDKQKPKPSSLVGNMKQLFHDICRSGWLNTCKYLV